MQCHWESKNPKLWLSHHSNSPASKNGSPTLSLAWYRCLQHLEHPWAQSLKLGRVIIVPWRNNQGTFPWLALQLAVFLLFARNWWPLLWYSALWPCPCGRKHYFLPSNSSSALYEHFMIASSLGRRERCERWTFMLPRNGYIGLRCRLKAPCTDESLQLSAALC